MAHGPTQDLNNYDRIVNIDGHVDLVDYVRAVIASLREPSEAMIEAGAVRRHEDGLPYLEDAAAVVWERAIDAMLQSDIEKF